MKKIIVLTFLFMTLAFHSLAFSKQLEKLTVILDSFPNPSHAPLFIAKQQGFFKAQGLDVKFIEPRNADDVFRQIQTHQSDIGLAYQPQFMEKIDEGMTLIRIGTLIDRPLNCIVVLNNSGIKSLNDLKGKQIAATPSKLSNIMLNVLLAKDGLSNKDIKLATNVNDPTQALLSHQVDAVTGMMRNIDVPQLEQAGNKLAVFFPEEHGIPNYSQIIIISHTDKANDKRFSRFLAALKNAVEYLDEHPRKTWQDFAKNYPESNNKINKEAWFATIPYFAEDPANFDSKEWNGFAKFMLENKMIKKIQPISRYSIIL